MGYICHYAPRTVIGPSQRNPSFESDQILSEYPAVYSSLTCSLRPGVYGRLAKLWRGIYLCEHRGCNRSFHVSQNTRYVDEANTHSPGCMDCHLDRVHCSVPVTPSDEEMMVSLQSSLKDFEPYPTSVDSILATWEGRFRKMHQLLWEPDLRSSRCHRYHHVEITQDSLLEDNDVAYLST